MNISIKTLLALAVFLLPACKRNPSTPYVQKVYEEAVRLQQAGNLNDAIFHYQLAATSCHTIEDSLSYWWKAMYGQGKIWKLFGRCTP
jgi:outer membrane protein assembly factor BamD (BamD/ComL family)